MFWIRFTTGFRCLITKENCEKVIVPDSYTVSHPRGIAADETSIYVCDTGNSRVIKMDLQGQNPKIIGRAGKGQVQFGNPIGIAVRGKELFVADTNNQRVQVISTGRRISARISC